VIVGMKAIPMLINFPSPRAALPAEAGRSLSPLGLRPDLYTQVDFSGEAASDDSLGRSPRNRATHESSAEGAAQMRRLGFAWRAKPKNCDP